MQITAAQLRAARALLDLGEAELADRARVPGQIVRYIESRDFIGTLQPNDIDALRRTLEEAGVEFIERGVRWRQKIAKT
jgi:hypothetical protein